MGSLACTCLGQFTAWLGCWSPELQPCTFRGHITVYKIFPRHDFALRLAVKIGGGKRQKLRGNPQGREE